MNERQTELAQQLVASKHWRWMDGMITACGLRVCEAVKATATQCACVIGHRSGPTRDGDGWYDGAAAGLIPDLDDPATIGCLLALVREVYGPRVWLMWSRGRAPRMEGGDSGFCELRDAFGRRVFSGEIVEHRTEAEALAAALLEAP